MSLEITPPGAVDDQRPSGWANAVMLTGHAPCLQGVESGRGHPISENKHSHDWSCIVDCLQNTGIWRWKSNPRPTTTLPSLTVRPVLSHCHWRVRTNFLKGYVFLYIFNWLWLYELLQTHFNTYFKILRIYITKKSGLFFFFLLWEIQQVSWPGSCEWIT